MASVVDIGSKSEGLIPANEMHSLGADPLPHVEMGEKIVAYVMQPETSEGEVLLSWTAPAASTAGACSRPLLRAARASKPK